jgi:hypothetical protein
MSSSKEVISAIKMSVKRLEELAPKLIEAYGKTFGPPPLTVMPDVRGEGEPAAERTSQLQEAKPAQAKAKEARHRVEQPIPSRPPGKAGLEGLEAVNLASLATFIARLAGRDGAIKLLNTYRSMGFISSEIHGRLTTLIRVLPSYAPAVEPDDVWADVIIGLINLYEKDPTNWGFLLLVRLVELVGEVHASVELE